MNRAKAVTRFDVIVLGLWAFAMALLYYFQIGNDVYYALSSQDSVPTPLWASSSTIGLLGMPLMIAVSGVLGYGLYSRPNWRRLMVWVGVAVVMFVLVFIALVYPHRPCESLIWSGAAVCDSHVRWVRDTITFYWTPIVLFSALPAAIMYVVARFITPPRRPEPSGVAAPSSKVPSGRVQ